MKIKPNILKRNDDVTLDLADDIKNIFNVSKVRQTFRLGSSVLDAMQPFIEKPTYLSAIRTLLSLGKVITDDLEETPENYFESSDWSEPYSRQFVYVIEKVLQKHNYTTIKTADDNVTIRLINLNGAKIGWTHSTKFGWTDQIYVETKKLNDAKESISELIWQQYKNKPIVMKRMKILVNQYVENTINFESDDGFCPLPSKKASDYSRYLKKCIDSGVHRGVMLYGPPGTGKSTMARSILENLKLTSLRIRVEDLADVDTSVVFEALSLLRPDAIILDDLDRSQSQSALLEILEYFQRHVKLVIATVNDRDSLDEALLRPGRFDELIFVDKLDSNVIKNLLGEFTDGYDYVKDWPIAFIQEYCKRRKFMNAEDAANSMLELSERVKRLSNQELKSTTTWDALRSNSGPKRKLV